MNEELLNCVQEICCVSTVEKPSVEAVAALVSMFHHDKCHTPEDCARMVFEYFTLAPRSFLPVKQEIARLAKA